MKFSGKLVNYKTAHVGIRCQLMMHCRLMDTLIIQLNIYNQFLPFANGGNVLHCDHSFKNRPKMITCIAKKIKKL